jgi:hypothetical protein
MSENISNQSEILSEKESRLRAFVVKAMELVKSNETFPLPF